MKLTNTLDMVRSLLLGSGTSMSTRPASPGGFTSLLLSALRGGEKGLVAQLADLLLLKSASLLGEPRPVSPPPPAPPRTVPAGSLRLPAYPPALAKPAVPPALPPPPPRPLTGVEKLTSPPDRRQAYDKIIRQAARRHGLDPNLVRAVITAESDFDPSCVSSAGAMGLMQLMPETARDLGVKDPFDPAQNIEAGTRYLAGLLRRFCGDLNKALAAYNWGPSNVEAGGPLPRETRDYLVKVARFHRLFGQGFSRRA